MKKLKPGLLLILTLAILSVLLASCQDEPGEVPESYITEEIGADGFKYTLLDDGTYSVSVGMAMYAEEISIPETYNGKAVTALADEAFANVPNLYSVKIPKSIKHIGKDAFLGSDGIESVHISDLGAWCGISFENLYSNPLSYYAELYVNDIKISELIIPNGIAAIPDYAFAHAKGVSAVKIPDTVMSVGEEAFAFCRELVNVELGEGIVSVKKNAFDGSYAIKYNAYKNSKYLGNEANPYIALISAMDERIFDTTVHKDAVTVAAGAFADCAEMTKIEFGSKLKTVGDGAFVGCDKLRRVDISDLSSWCSVAFDGVFANPVCKSGNLFLNGTEITRLEIPENATRVGAYAFYNASSVTEIIVPNTVKELGECVFAYCENLEKISIGDGVSEIPERALEHCKSLDTLNLGKEIKSIGNYAFYYCTALRSFDAPRKTESIGASAFFGCSKLNDITLGDGVRTLGNGAFSSCTSLDKLVLPTGLEKIEARAFLGCIALMSVTLPSSISVIEEGAFSDCFKLVEVINHSPLTLTAGSSENGSVALYAGSVHSGKSKIESIDGYYFYELSGENYLIGAPDGYAIFKLPDSYKGESYSVYDYAFAGRVGVNGITVSQGVIEIGDFAFFGCADVLSLNLGSSLKRIGDYSFSECEKITRLSIPESVNDIGAFAFSRCTSLKNLTLGGAQNVGENAFYKCGSLEEVGIGDSIKKIGTDAFRDCEEIKNVSISSLAAWCSVKLGSHLANPLFYAENLYTGGASSKSIVIPEGVEGISKFAFYGFFGAYSVTLPKTLSEIDDFAFYSCGRLFEVINLSEIDISVGDTSNGYVANHALTVHSEESKIEVLDGFTFLSSDGAVYLIDAETDSSELILPESLNGQNYVIHNYALAGLPVTAVKIPSAALGIGDYAFFACSELKELNIPDSVLYIGSYAFASCTALESVSVGDGVSTIGSWAFKNAESLKNLILGKGLVRIGTAAFYSCKALEKITVPYSVDYIGSFAFSGCEKLAFATFERMESWRYVLRLEQLDEINEDELLYKVPASYLVDSAVMAERLKGAYEAYFLVRYVPPVKENTEEK